MTAWVRAAVAVGVAVLAYFVLARIRDRVWGSDREIAVRVFTASVSGAGYEDATAAVAGQTGAPVWYVRQVVDRPAVTAPCTEVKRNPWKAVAYVVGSIATAVVTAIAPPAGAAVGVVSGFVATAQPAYVQRACR